ncbi:hypothetical protein Pla52n_38510 [Stieleria varia]|uniref:Uncharacterized protein n=1 Tax=Stieleria varia TaxID=2528005 RepID=A0A5C6AUU9_9BACT|nr:hypothetical protein Pla52n_38510 [Stieleria varia]
MQRCNLSAESGPKSKGALAILSSAHLPFDFGTMRKISGGLGDWSPKYFQPFPTLKFHVSN